MTGPRSIRNSQLEGSFHSHQVPLPQAATDDEEFEKLNDWLKSYDVHELFDKARVSENKGWFVNEKPLSILPQRMDRRMGMLKVRNIFDSSPSHTQHLFF